MIVANLQAEMDAHKAILVVSSPACVGPRMLQPGTLSSSSATLPRNPSPGIASPCGAQMRSLTPPPGAMVGTGSMVVGSPTQQMVRRAGAPTTIVRGPPVGWAAGPASNRDRAATMPAPAQAAS